MGQLSATRTEQVRHLIRMMPDKALQTLDGALSGGGQDPRLLEVHDLIGDERMDRRLGEIVLGPVAPLCRLSLFSSQPLPPDAPRRLWAALILDEPHLVEEARRALHDLQIEDASPAVFDHLCRRAAERLRLRDGAAFGALAEAFDGAQSGTAGRLADALGLAPIARDAIPRLPGWLRLMNDDTVAAIHLAYRDAMKQGADMPPILTEMFAAHLDHPYQVLRLISAVMDRPSDRYMAASEMAGFGERLLADMERRVEAVNRFDPHGGAEAGQALAASVLVCTHTFGEFEQWLTLSRDGPWGMRLIMLRRGLAAGVEARLREVAGAVAAALPAQPMRSGNTLIKAAPRLNQPLSPRALDKARGLLAFLADTRAAAPYGGYVAIRNKVIEALDSVIDQYAEDLLEIVHAPADRDQAERARAFLEVAAEFLGFVREPKAAEIVRRRAAAA